MIYKNTCLGRFISRPNRFIAHVEIQGEVVICHVKNTGRCKELLVPNALVVLEKAENPLRKTPYDLIAVYKNEKVINIDSVAPNKVFGEWAKVAGYFGEITKIKPECTYKNSRFDYYIEADDKKIFIEVKGVTLEKEGILMFPDAPTLRGVKHLNELADAAKNGYESYVFFVAQMEECKYFTPNQATDSLFANTLREVAAKGVKVCCVNCHVGEDRLSINTFVDVVL